MPALRQGIRTSAIVTLAALTFAVATRVRADDLPRAGDVATLFAIRKSQNRNRVDYGLRLGSGCSVVGDAPVFPYWRMLERGADVLQPLLRREQRAYGVAEQRVLASNGATHIGLRLRALRGKRLAVTVRAAGSGCATRVTVPIDGVSSALEDVYVVLGGPMSIEHVELRGRSVADGAPTFERLEP